ncbi:MAG: alanine racemase [Alphaproteobacteria bacterium]
MANLQPGWSDWKRWLASEPLPAAMVYLPALDENILRIRAAAEKAGKSLRVASKSVRCVSLLRRIFAKGGDVFQGLMCFAVPEAARLVDEGFTDLLVAYPTIQPADTALAAELAGRRIGFKLVVDSVAHLEALAVAAKKQRTIVDVVLELDVSYRPAYGRVHIGARRSPLRKADHVEKLVQAAQQIDGVRVVGLMGYEAHIAGVQDKNPFDKWLNPVKTAIKLMSVPDVASRRSQAVEAMRKAGVDVQVVNGGGTGSLDSTGRDPSVTELTAGSGFYCPQLFSYYRTLDLIPAAFFASQVVRVSDPEYITCAGGGYIASGPVSADKQPASFLPAGLTPVAMEGAGEVQTPLDRTGCREPIEPGDPILFRHAKAGELCERFNELLLVGPDGIEDRVPTYRGQGWVFF